MSDEIYFTPQQYDLLTIDKPEKKRVRPAAALAFLLHGVFKWASDRDIYIAANKLNANGIGTNSLKLALDKLIAIPYWLDYVTKMRSNPMTLVPRIEQAAGHAEQGLHPVEPEDMLLELRARRARNLATEKRLVAFFQSIHSASPIMRKYIKTAAEQVVKASFIADPLNGADLTDRAIDRLSSERAWIDRQIEQCRVPKETAQKLIQIIQRLSGG